MLAHLLGAGTSRPMLQTISALLKQAHIPLVMMQVLLVALLYL